MPCPNVQSSTQLHAPATQRSRRTCRRGCAPACATPRPALRLGAQRGGRLDDILERGGGRVLAGQHSQRALRGHVSVLGGQHKVLLRGRRRGAG